MVKRFGVKVKSEKKAQRKPPIVVKKCYHGGKLWNKINGSFSNFSEIVDADVNDAYYQPAPQVIEKLKNALLNINHTPDVYNKKPKSFIAEQLELPEENICLGNGSSEISYAVFGSLLTANDSAALFYPTYGEYERFFSVIGAKVNKVWLDEKDGFALDKDKLAEKALETKAKIIVVCNPNNPTGTFLEKEGLLEILQKIGEDQFLVVDEAYGEYLDPSQSLLHKAPHLPNLIVLKTFSKCFALGGLRAGYCIANKDLIKKIEERLPPWNVNILAQLAILETLQNKQYYTEKIKETLEIKDVFFEELKKIAQITPFSSATNYILIKLNEEQDAEEICEKLNKQNILIRNCASFGQDFSKKFIRITVRQPEVNKKVLKALKEALNTV